MICGTWLECHPSKDCSSFPPSFSPKWEVQIGIWWGDEIVGDLAELVGKGSHASSKIKQLPLKVTRDIVPWTSREHFSETWEMVSRWDISGSIHLQRWSCCVILRCILFSLRLRCQALCCTDLQEKVGWKKREGKCRFCSSCPTCSQTCGHLLIFLGPWSSDPLWLKYAIDLFVEDGCVFWLCLAIHWKPTSLQMRNDGF